MTMLPAGEGVKVGERDGVGERAKGAATHKD